MNLFAFEKRELPILFYFANLNRFDLDDSRSVSTPPPFENIRVWAAAATAACNLSVCRCIHSTHFMDKSRSALSFHHHHHHPTRAERFTGDQEFLKKIKDKTCQQAPPRCFLKQPTVAWAEAPASILCKYIGDALKVIPIVQQSNKQQSQMTYSTAKQIK